MKIKFIVVFVLVGTFGLVAQETEKSTYQKKVLESTEVDILMSYYAQEGIHSAVAGGEGTQELTDFTSSIIISLPVNINNILTIDVGISAYTSASSSNIDPFDSDKPASPWYASSGASESDVLIHGSADYSHSSEDRNTIVSGNISFSSEYDYFSLGFGGSFTKLFNEKNTELSFKGQVYLDKWKSIYPKELREFFKDGLDGEFFREHTITGNPNYNPSAFFPNIDENRNSYSLSVSFSQILTKNIQGSLFFDLVVQEGLLSTPYHRVYFADRPNSFIEDFQLADDNENLPTSRFKIPIGARLNFYINEYIVIRSYYRYYDDDWGIISHTASIELPIKIASKFTIAPLYRYYSQTASDYFAPKEVHLSTDEYYTSDYDLSAFDANQFGVAIKYTDIFTKAKIWKFGLKSIDLRYNHYQRSNDLNADILTLGVKFID